MNLRPLIEALTKSVVSRVASPLAPAPASPADDSSPRLLVSPSAVGERGRFSDSAKTPDRPRVVTNPDAVVNGRRLVEAVRLADRAQARMFKEHTK
jgi:hypothetical protein